MKRKMRKRNIIKTKIKKRKGRREIRINKEKKVMEDKHVP